MRWPAKFAAAAAAAATAYPDSRRGAGRRPEHRPLRGDRLETLFLLSEMSSCITGQTLAVDGGTNLKSCYVDEDNIPAYARVRDALKAKLREG